MGSASGFVDALANYVVTLDSTLTKGTDLFNGYSRDLKRDAVDEERYTVISDGFSEVNPANQFALYAWTIRLVTGADTKAAAISRASELAAQLYNKTPEVLSDAGERFFVKWIRPIQPGAVVTTKQENGRYEGTAFLEIQAMPKS